MSGFRRQAVVAVAIWVGLALFNVGPRASAAFWPALSSPQNSGGAGGAADYKKPMPSHQSSLDLKAELNDAALLAVLQQLNGASQGGATAPTSSSSSGTGVGPALTSIQAVPMLAASVGKGLSLPEIRPGPSPLLTSIFEPPRVS